MDSRIRLYRFVLIINAMLISIAIVLAVYFTTTMSSLFIKETRWCFILPLIFFLINSLYIMFFLNIKYPELQISNKIEGFLYLFEVLTFLSGFFVIFFNSVFVGNILDDNFDPHKKIWQYVSIPSCIVMICSVSNTIYSFKILKNIRRNRQELAQQIRNIGTGYK